MEGISYGMPVYRLEGILVYMGAFKNHCSLFAMPSAVLKFQKELKNYTTSKGTIQFTLQDSLPKELVARIIQYRVKENQAKAARKKKSWSVYHRQYHQGNPVIPLWAAKLS